MKKLEGLLSLLLHFVRSRVVLAKWWIISTFIFRQRGLSGKANAVDGARRVRARERGVGRAVPAPEANAEIQANLDVCEMSFVLLHILVIFYIFGE